MSLPGSANVGVAGTPAPAPVEKQHTNVFTMMLMISFLALVVGSVMLALEWGRFPNNPPWNTNAPPPAAQGS